MIKRTARGFTLVELLVVIAIIAILAAVVVLIINPLELMKRSRDAARLTDLANLQTAINVAVQESTNSGQALACKGIANPADECSSKSTDTDARKIDGTGWVEVDMASQKSVSVPTLPVDPINNLAYHYTYCGQGENWRIETVLESTQQTPKMATDGGPEDGLYEVGSDMIDDVGPDAGVTVCAY